MISVYRKQAKSVIKYFVQSFDPVSSQNLIRLLVILCCNLLDVLEVKYLCLVQVVNQLASFSELDFKLCNAYPVSFCYFLKYLACFLEIEMVVRRIPYKRGVCYGNTVGIDIYYFNNFLEPSCFLLVDDCM